MAPSFSSMLAKIFGGLIPLLSIGVIVFQIFTSADEDTVIQTSGVHFVNNVSWSVNAYDYSSSQNRVCIEERCYENTRKIFSKDGLTLPQDDPLGNGFIKSRRPFLVQYKASLKLQKIDDNNDIVVYLPGIKADQVFASINGIRVVESRGGLPFFISIPSGVDPKKDIQFEIVLLANENSQFQGFIRSQMFYGTALNVYRTHFRLSFKSFPRQAAVLFFLSTGALTFAFFLFLDRRRELFALGLAVSILGFCESIRLGIIPFLATRAFFPFFCSHMFFLSWYILEIAKTKVPLKALTVVFSSIILAHFASYFFSQTDFISDMRFYLLQSLNITPIVAVFFAVSVNRRKIFDLNNLDKICLFSFLIYASYLLASDLEKYTSFKIATLHEIPVLMLVTLWITSALSTLGSLEARVEAAVVDREKRLLMESDLALAQTVQQAFIRPGLQEDPQLEVLSVYKAARVVGGDWLAWERLSEKYGVAIVGDFVGKGTQAGLIVSACDAGLQMVKAEFSKNPNLTPEEIVRNAIKGLYQAVFSIHSNRAMSLFIALFENDQKFWFANLGHPPATIIGQKEFRVLLTGNPWLSRDFPLEQVKVKSESLKPNELLLMYTDGVCDGSRQLKAMMRELQSLPNHLNLNALSDYFTSLSAEKDDVSVMMVKRKEESLLNFKRGAAS